MRILVAEDRKIVAARLSAQLERLGHQVVAVAPDGRAAVESARTHQPDLAVFGLHLSTLDGIEAARALLSTRPLPIILLSDYAAADLVRRAQETGVLVCAPAPSELLELRTAIELARTRFGELRVILEEAAGELPQALRARVVVERAKRMLMRHLGLLEAEAFRYLRRQSHGLGQPVTEVAANLLAADDLLFSRPPLARCLQGVLQALGRGETVPPRVA